MKISLLSVHAVLPNSLNYCTNVTFILAFSLSFWNVLHTLYLYKAQNFKKLKMELHTKHLNRPETRFLFMAVLVKNISEVFILITRTILIQISAWTLSKAIKRQWMGGGVGGWLGFLTIDIHIPVAKCARFGVLYSGTGALIWNSIVLTIHRERPLTFSFSGSPLASSILVSMVSIQVTAETVCVWKLWYLGATTSKCCFLVSVSVLTVFHWIFTCDDT